MGGVFYVWLIPLLAVVALALGIFYLCLRRNWSTEAEPKSPLEQAQELERDEAQASQVKQTDAPGQLPT
jgi:hypothetical protein